MLNEKLTTVKWREFQIKDIAEVKTGVDIYYHERIEGNTPYVSSTSVNNGISHFVNNRNKTLSKNVISVNRNGSVGYAFYHEYTALFSNDVRIVIPKYNSKYSNLFLVTIISNQKEKYSWGYKLGLERLMAQKILLPIDNEGNPDWLFMENFMKEIEQAVKPEIHMNKYDITDQRDLEDVEWKEFKIHSIFKIKRGKRLVKREQKSGSIPYISSTAENNGIDNLINPPSKMELHSNCLTIANSGSVGTAFYHPYEFVASDHVTVLKNEKLNSYNSQFIISILNRLKDKYSFNREINNTRLKNEIIILPTDTKGNPDWLFMEQYMKKLENELLV